MYSKTMPTDSGRYTYKIVLVDENDRVMETTVSADAAIEAISAAKRRYGNGWSVRSLKLFCAN